MSCSVCVCVGLVCSCRVFVGGVVGVCCLQTSGQRVSSWLVDVEVVVEVLIEGSVRLSIKGVCLCVCVLSLARS